MLAQTSKVSRQARRSEFDDSFCVLRTSILLTHFSKTAGPRFFEDIHKFLISPGNLERGGFAGDLLRPHVHEWVPEAGPAYGKADKTFDRRRSGQPLAYLLVILSAF